jgi:hypothetical protein
MAYSKKADKNLSAMGAGERESKKVATIYKKDGTSFKRKNANQFYPDGVPGGLEYTEKRPNRTDKGDWYNTGGNTGGYINLIKLTKKIYNLSDKDFSGLQKNWKKLSNEKMLLADDFAKKNYNALESFSGEPGDSSRLDNIIVNEKGGKEFIEWFYNTPDDEAPNYDFSDFVEEVKGKSQSGKKVRYFLEWTDKYGRNSEGFDTKEQMMEKKVKLENSSDIKTKGTNFKYTTKKFMAGGTTYSKKADKNLSAMGAGERESKKVATIYKKDGTSFKRKNANQFYPDGVPGGLEYTEKRPNRTDKGDWYEDGGMTDTFVYTIGGL